MRPLCLLFDCDGTLVDSEPLLADEMATSLNAVGLPFQAADYIGEFRGARFRHIVAELERRHGSVDAQRLEPLEREMRANLNRRLATDLTPIEGATEALAVLASIPMGVVSNGPTNKIRTSLHATGLDELFGEHLFSAYDAQCWKPDPGLYLHAARQMGFAPADCVAIDDSLVGVQAALAAGMTVIHLNRFPDVEETPEGALSITSMFQLPTVISRLTQAQAMAN
ncbi:HAD family hydrolase [Halomonas elongata]|uniref:HAD superfamily hydrolase n=1 Tax=Halomonas elongata (strain ATCC 33173 / DSM 2581 / NBRC 15536 / NCIMB 2198 / 1H9) TaxID=768066 RepID=E1V510_HALED|nr:HAD-IA family hydrolase [Halomonas elongata]WBF19939.1 HAD-IA family hydrolase [Halomonas elongata]WPU49237.1 HAD-IA family hydrolase [Halomonas elongata DSM 2581]WVI73348.1 HAD-IA family hydrolase [Halomonas elongata]CBV41059.1 HAD superfamily hydrolase [Halomonas elongata DSM 2581]